MFSPEWGYSFLKDKGCYFLNDEKVTKESPKGSHDEISAQKRLISYVVSPLDSRRCDEGHRRGTCCISSGTVHLTN